MVVTDGQTSRSGMPASQGHSGEPDIGRAPGDLAILQAFVNTLDIEQGADELATPAGLASWLHEAGLVADRDGQSGPRDLALAIDLREALRGVLRSHVTHSARRNRSSAAAAADNAAADAASADAGPEGADSPGNRAAEAGPAVRVAAIAASMRAGIQADRSGRVVVVPAGSGATAALTRLLLIAAEAATAGTWSRLKVCSADDCQWAFYDRSPTRSGCWCSMQICGSRAKARAYRSRVMRTR
jgi:predicted RNA-binding Zn ribbon-like protein